MRFLGSTQSYAPIEHPLLKHPFIWAAPLNELKATGEGVKLEVLRLVRSETREWQIMKGDKRSALDDWTPSDTFNGVWLEVIDPGSVAELPDLSQFVHDRGLQQSVVFTSPYQKIIREMRKIEPLWVYGSSTAESSRTRFFTSLFLEPIANINADILVLRKPASPRLARELHKRHKKLFLVVRSVSEISALKAAQMIDGAIVAP